MTINRSNRKFFFRNGKLDSLLVGWLVGWILLLPSVRKGGKDSDRNEMRVTARQRGEKIRR